MRRYPKELVKKLNTDKTMIREYGMDIVLKKSPSESRKGCMDLYEAAALGKAVEHVGEKNCDIPPIPVLVKLMRDSMGFPNLNLNEQEIYTKYEKQLFDGNEVELWRYYLRRSTQKIRPAFIMIHGGGWVGGTVYVVENFCKLIAERADAVVFNIEYSKAPEKPFPNGLRDCCHALEYIYEHAAEYGIDRERIAIGGDSAGGNLAIGAAMLARDQNRPYVRQLAVAYPCTIKCDAGAEGYQWTKDAYEISEEQRSLIEGCLGLGRPVPFGGDPLDRMCMASKEDIYNPYYSPMLDPDKSNMPKTLIMTCEFDGLRQQDEFYGMQLKAAGNHVRVVRYGGISHAAIGRLGYIPQAEDMADEIVRAILEM